jgi:hypothetical protein
MVAVTVSLAREFVLDADKGVSLRLSCRVGQDIFRILEGQESHEIGVMDDEGFGGAFDQVAFGGVGRDDVADRVGNAALESQRDAGEGMAQGLAAFALATLASGPISYSRSLPTSARIAPAMTASRLTGNARPMKACMALALSRVMWTTQRLCSMKVMGQFGTRSVNGIWFRSSGWRELR